MLTPGQPPNAALQWPGHFHPWHCISVHLDTAHRRMWPAVWPVHCKCWLDAVERTAWWTLGGAVRAALAMEPECEDNAEQSPEDGGNERNHDCLAMPLAFDVTTLKVVTESQTGGEVDSKAVLAV
jgi:hypothetical protein